MPRCDIWLTLGSMPAARSRSMFFGAVLALIAVLAAFGVSTWHNTNLHDDAPSYAIPSHHGHEAQEPDDADGAFHLAAHAVGQALDLPVAALAPPGLAIVPAMWSIQQLLPSTGLDPASLLRPPQV
jgi:hypothetical protein